MWSWQQHHRLSDAGRRIHVELATAPRIIRRWPMHTCRAGNSTTDYPALANAQHNTCGAGNSTMALIFGVAPSWPTHTCGAGNSTTDYPTLADTQHNTCGAGNSTMAYATLIFSVAPSWPTSNTCGAGTSLTRSSDWQCSGLHYAHLSLFSPV